MQSGSTDPRRAAMARGFAGPANRSHQLFSKLEREGKYAEIDKAKHNEHYLNYLLENFEDDF